MARRFSKLEKEWVDALTNGTGISADAKTYIKKYDSYKRHKSGRNRKGVKTLGRTFVAIRGFAYSFPTIAAATGKLYIKVSLSKRALAYLDSADAASLSRSDLNYIKVGAGSAAIPVDGYQPAKVVVGIKNTGTGKVTSEITGRQYTRSSLNSYVLPFGKEGSKTYLTVVTELSNLIKGKNLNYSFIEENISKIAEVAPDVEQGDTEAVANGS